jgi:hypothetical protein
MESFTDQQKTELLKILEERIIKNQYVADLTWNDVSNKITAQTEKLWSLYQMEITGGEPNLVAVENDTLIFYDCSLQTPAGRISLCYDEQALRSRKKNKPAGSAWGLADQMGVKILNEKEYHFLQILGEFDTKTSSWLNTPAKIRRLGGAIFGDRRYDHVFTYHNGAESYYAARGFRAALHI